MCYLYAERILAEQQGRREVNFLSKAMVIAATSLGVAGAVSADSWTVDGANSNLSFGSIKKDTVGEVHSFTGLSGSVSADGAVMVEIDLTSVETNIDIRNERMIEHVFQNAPSAMLSAEMDMSEIKTLGVGDTTSVDFDGVLSFLGAQVDVSAEMFVARLSDTKVMATSSMIFVSVEDLGVSAGIDKLMELAKLPGITRTTPVVVRMIFNADEQKAEVAPAAPATEVAAITGDVKKGKKVFNKCKACHKLKEGKNGTGPSLYAVFGRTAGTIDGFKYSPAMAESGIVWTAETLAAFVKNPKTYVPKNKMSFRGLRKDADIENLIAYLADKTAE